MTGFSRVRLDDLLAGTGIGTASTSAQISDDIEARVLLDLGQTVTRDNPFKFGDLIRQRKGCDCYTFGNKLAVVTGVIPAFIEPDAGAQELRNDTLILVRMGNDLTPQEFCVQSWRFDRYDGPVA